MHSETFVPGSPTGGQKEGSHIFYLLADIGFQVGKLFPGPKYNCETWACRKVTHVCVMTLSSFFFSLQEVRMVSVMVKDTVTNTGTKGRLVLLLKIVQYTVGLVFIVYDTATLNPPGVGTRVLIAAACLSEIILVFLEVYISITNGGEAFWAWHDRVISRPAYERWLRSRNEG
jgi:hypothetical protein